MVCVYDKNTNTFNMMKGNRVVEQIPGTAMTLRCNKRQISALVAYFQSR